MMGVCRDARLCALRLRHAQSWRRHSRATPSRGHAACTKSPLIMLLHPRVLPCVKPQDIVITLEGAGGIKG